ncbi:hypothetical protein WICPIJ_004298 [Wickerhamomyces pijperi]|uniref:Uncharacterized protein n=1 Tax=Wickerhamomyces pijperi TaxID=599730 RepID=A0A9P8Q662_WICPI|nr:hypothetical protein WICPIJ_004298 [Wickerhamomyces pijperi]
MYFFINCGKSEDKLTDSLMMSSISGKSGYFSSTHHSKFSKYAGNWKPSLILEMFNTNFKQDLNSGRLEQSKDCNSDCKLRLSWNFPSPILITLSKKRKMSKKTSEEIATTPSHDPIVTQSHDFPITLLEQPWHSGELGHLDPSSK